MLTEFLQHLCERTRKGPPLGQASGPIPGDQIYCTTAQRFKNYLRHPPAGLLLRGRLPQGLAGFAAKAETLAADRERQAALSAPGPSALTGAGRGPRGSICRPANPRLGACG